MTVPGYKLGEKQIVFADLNSNHSTVRKENQRTKTKKPYLKMFTIKSNEHK
jgi:hypothetical protein